MVNILPYEHAKESRQVYERAHLALALSAYKKTSYKKAFEILEQSKKWPENIGVGKPFDPDERAQDYLMALTLDKLGNTEKAQNILDSIVGYTEDHMTLNTVNHLFGLLATEKRQGKEAGNQLASELAEATDKNNKRSRMALNLHQTGADQSTKTDVASAMSKEIYDLSLWAIKSK